MWANFFFAQVMKLDEDLGLDLKKSVFALNDTTTTIGRSVSESVRLIIVP